MISFDSFKDLFGLLGMPMAFPVFNLPGTVLTLADLICLNLNLSFPGGICRIDCLGLVGFGLSTYFQLMRNINTGYKLQQCPVFHLKFDH